ncbi:MAG: type II toxin-antitoxin system HicA family toxin [Chloroflexota bacterium]
MKKFSLVQKISGLRNLLRSLSDLASFKNGLSGSHHIFAHPQIARPFPIQDVKGKAKPYQVEQLLKLVEEYDLRLEEE